MKRIKLFKRKSTFNHLIKNKFNCMYLILKKENNKGLI